MNLIFKNMADGQYIKVDQALITDWEMSKIKSLCFGLALGLTIGTTANLGNTVFKILDLYWAMSVHAVYLFPYLVAFGLVMLSNLLTVYFLVTSK